MRNTRALTNSLVYYFAIIIVCIGGNNVYAFSPIFVDSSFYGGAGNQYGRGVIADANNLYLCGSDTQNWQSTFLKYSLPSGSSPIWSDAWPASSGAVNELFTGLVEVGDSVYLAGASYSQTTDSVGDKEYKAVLLKASKDGFTGADVGGSDWFEAPHFRPYSGGEMFLSIISVVEGSNTYLYASAMAQSHGSNYTTLLTKYDLNGTSIWSELVSDPAIVGGAPTSSITEMNGIVYVAASERRPDVTNAIAYIWGYDPDGGLVSTFQYPEAGAYLYAVCNDGEFIYTAGLITDGPNGGDDVLILKYDLAGILVDTVEWGGSGDESAHGIIEKDGTLYLTGRTNSFGSGGYDAFLLAIDSTSGDVKSSDYYGGSNDESGRAITLSGNDIYITGDSKSFAVNGNSIGEFELMLLRYHISGYIYVDNNATGDNNGSSWTDAYTSLQDALDNAVSGAEIWVAEGTYYPSAEVGGAGDRYQTFQMINDVAIYGGFNGTETLLSQRNVENNETILSGDLNGDDGPDFANNSENSYNVVTSSYNDDTAVLDGFTITAGNASLEGAGGGGYGGGMSNDHSSPTVINCIFSGNKARYGGGMGNFESSSPIVTGCTFINNTSDGGSGMLNKNGSNTILTNCTFSENRSVLVGGGMYSVDSNMTMINCTFTGNSAGDKGGGMGNNQNSSPTITNCTFSGNSAISLYGGGIWNWDSSNPTVTNCILWGNTAPLGSELYNDSSTPVISYCDIEGSGGSGAGWDTSLGTDGGGNIDANPKIKDAAGHIWNTSPCKNAGDPAFVIDPSSPVDIDGQNRVMDGRVDMGVDELLPSIQNITTSLTYNTIQLAINAATNEDTIVVQDGTYYTPGPAGIDFGGKEIILRSSDPDDPEMVAATIIDCLDSGRGFYFHTDENPNSVLDGFTITNGSSGGGDGGAITCISSSSPMIKNCVITGNNAVGLSCDVNSDPTIMDSTIKDNSPYGIEIDATSSVLIVGVVRVISNDIFGEGSVEMESGASLDTADCVIYIGTMTGPGTIQIDLGTEVLIDGNSSIDLSDPLDPDNPDLWGTINGEGVLNMADYAQITRAIVNLSQADITDNASITDSEIHIDDSVPYGQVFASENAIIEDNIIYANGDRYMNLDPSIFAGSFKNNRIYVTITEGVGDTRGGLFELRGAPDLAVTGSCDPESKSFLCQVATNTIPDCNTVTWTIEELKLVEGAKLNLTNRFPFKPPYDSGGEDEVLYVKKLIMEPDSVLNTSYNNVYYGTLEKAPSAVIKDIPLLGFSLINIALNDEREYIARVIGNNFTHPWDPNYSRTHIDRIEGQQPDPAGMMKMINLMDLEPTSEFYTNKGLINARAKGTFAKASEGKITITFEYMFVDDPGDDAELIVYLSGERELSAGLVEVARVRPPASGRAGSVGSNEFATFFGTFSSGDLNFIRGTYIELELQGSDGTCCFIDNWDPLVYCATECRSFDGYPGVNIDDYFVLLAEYGLSGPSVEKACLDMNNDGVVNTDDLNMWDVGNALHLCPDGDGILMGALSSSVMHPLEVTGSTELAPLVITGKPVNTLSVVPDNNLYGIDGYGNDIGSTSGGANGRLVVDSTNMIYQLDADRGLIYSIPGMDFSDPNIVVIDPDNNITFGNYTVSVGVKNDLGMALTDVAFDSDDPGIAYVVPVLVEEGNSRFKAAAKLELMGDGQYEILDIYGTNPATDPDQGNTIPDPNNYVVYAPDLQHLKEIEVDPYGNVFVLSTHNLNKNNWILVYDDSGDRVQLVDPNFLNGSGIIGPTAMIVSSVNDKLYLASTASTSTDANSLATYIHRFDILRNSGVITGIAYADSVTVNCPSPGFCNSRPELCSDERGYVAAITSMTEDASDGTICATGFTMPKLPSGDDIEGIGNLSIDSLFTTPMVVIVPVNATGPVFADLIIGSDLALPMSIIWTGEPVVKCGGADIVGSDGRVDFNDFAVLASQWQQTVDIADLAAFAEHWLDTNCN